MRVRYLIEPFALGALRRGKSIGQFLGGVPESEKPCIRWVEVRPDGGRYRVVLHTLEDVGGEGFADLIEFPPLDPDDEDEEFGREIGSADDPLAALHLAEARAGAVRERWVNQGVEQDEYLDFVRAGRPADR